MPVLMHKRPEGEIVVQACESWKDGVELFWSVLERHYGDSPKSIWETVEREDDGALAAVGVAGDVVVMTAHGLMLDPEGCYMVMPEDGEPWPIARRRDPDDADVAERRRRKLASIGERCVSGGSSGSRTHADTRGSSPTA